MDRSAVTLERMRTFVRVAQRGTLSAVARELGSGQSTVSRHLRELEAAVGAPLINRTTRRLALTDEGTRFHAECVRILALVDQATDDASAAGAATAGTVRVSTTAALGVRYVTRLMLAFQTQNPDIRVDLGLTDERIDLVKQGVDIAIRLGPLTDSTLKRRRIGDSERILVAAPSYLSAQGRPLRPNDLGAHAFVRMANVAGSDRIDLIGPDGRHHSIAVTGRLCVDHGLAAREALVAGAGIGPTHRWLVDDLLAAGMLQPLLPDYRLPPMPLNMLILPERAGIRRVRLLIDYLADCLPRLPGISASSA